MFIIESRSVELVLAHNESPEWFETFENEPNYKGEEFHQ
jgi:hypothetical protein